MGLLTMFAVSAIHKYVAHKTFSLYREHFAHRGLSVLLFNNNSELLLQRISYKKPTFPRCWSTTCCSHPHYTPEEMESEHQLGVKRAAIARLEFELGIKEIKEEDLVFGGKLLYWVASSPFWKEHEGTVAPKLSYSQLRAHLPQERRPQHKHRRGGRSAICGEGQVSRVPR